MNTKPCVTCGASDRYENSGKCKPCVRLRVSDYQKNSLSYKAKKQEYANNKKNKIAEYQKVYKKLNRVSLSKKKQSNYIENREHQLYQKKDYYVLNKEIILQKSSEYQKKNRKARTAYGKEYTARRKQTDVLFALSLLYRTRTGQAFSHSNFDKKTKVIDLLGCNWEVLKAHIESKFKKGMTWENRGIYGWHVDHKIPLASANYVEELEALCHYSNLQPMWAKDNLSKNSMLPCGKRIKKKQN